MRTNQAHRKVERQQRAFARWVTRSTATVDEDGQAMTPDKKEYAKAQALALQEKLKGIPNES